MKFPIYCVRDRLTGYGIPVLRDNDSVASRAFEFDLNQANSPYAHHPQDYQLFRIGEFDTESGVILPEDPVLVANATDLVKEK